MDQIGTAASSAISGSQSVDEVLDELQTWATERMDRAGYYE